MDQNLFEKTYRCYSLSSKNKNHLESGDKIIMPHSAFDVLASLEVDYPMLFEINNPEEERVSHCGVLEFTAEEGTVLLPQWMMENLLLQGGDCVILRNVSLPKGKFVKLQPHTKDFLDIEDIKEVLETILRSYSCLTTGDTVMLAYGEKKYYVNILETRPAKAVSVIETNCEVDFAPPLDYVEPEVPVATTVSSEATVQEVDPMAIMGQGRRLDGKPSTLTLASFAKETHKECVCRSGSTSVCSCLVYGSTSQPSRQLENNQVSSGLQPKRPKYVFVPFVGRSYKLGGR